jgi:hypothetical protein
MTYFALCIFISAFLLFQVEPMIAKYILPWFGGTPAVWSTVMLFFQVMLTGGYAYAAWLTRKKRRREWIHLVLLGASVLVMLILFFLWKSPITPGTGWKPSGEASPIGEIFKLLLISVGLPYFMLSSNSSLIQTWFNQAFPKKTAYRLYALSNVGSLLGLVTYPLLIEPYMTLTWQGRIWSVAYVVYAGLAAYGAVNSLRTRGNNQTAPAADEHVDLPSLAAKDVLLWLALPTTASLLLLAVTNQITQEVAVIPFLWVLPLTIYLLTFILAFSGEGWYSRQAFLIIFFIAMVSAGWALRRSETLPMLAQIGIYCLVLFAACMVCHGEVYRLRPHPSRLTLFYLMVSVGGALGGIVINFVAPYVFKGFWELPLGLMVCWLLFVIVTAVSKGRKAKRLTFVANWALLLSGLLVACVQSYQQIYVDLSNKLFVERNFYGVVRVKLDGTPPASQRYILAHGVTLHGFQYVDHALRNIPTSYYGETGGGGLAILNSPKRGQDMRVGVLGLGIGTLAAYGQPGDVYRFYEINPIIIRLAQGEGGYFSYLTDSAAKIEIVPGDARLSLERELSSGQLEDYDVLVLDVFTGDSIPVHLLDEQAFNLYLQMLAPDGILAAHISNRHLDLVPVVWTLADHFKLSRVVIDDPGNGISTTHSLWILLASDPAVLAVPPIAGRSLPMSDYRTRVGLWTDDFNNLIQILH